MIRPSPATAKIAATLNFFIRHSQQTFTLTQVAKSLRLSPASTLSILRSLAEADYIYRRTDKRYVFGPKLRALSTGANPPLPPLQVAAHEMRTLADDLDIVASALFREGEEIVVRHRAVSVNHLGFARLPSPQRYSLHPWGSVFLAPLGEAEVAAEFDRAAPALDDEARRNAMVGIDFVRRHGFAVALQPDPDEGDLQALRPTRRYLAYPLPGETYRLSFVVAPVMGFGHDVVFAISMFGFDRPMTAEQTMAAGRRLCETCERITAFITANHRQNPADDAAP